MCCSSAERLLQASTLVTIEKRASDYQAEFKRKLKEELQRIDDIPEEDDLASKAKKYQFRLPPLPCVRNSKSFMDAAMFNVDSGKFSDMHEQQQKQIQDLVATIADGSEEPIVLALTQVMQDDDLYAPMLTGNKAELSWRLSAPWRGITEVAVILRNTADIAVADAEVPALSQYTLPASLSVEVTWPSHSGLGAYTLALQLLIAVVDDKPTEVSFVTMHFA